MKPKENCPLNKFKPCKQFECTWYIQVRGTNPNSGKEVDEYGCAMAWMPILLLEGAQQQKSTGAAIESFRNEVVKANKENQFLFVNSNLHDNPKLINNEEND